MLKWGIIGTGRIAKRFMKGLSYSKSGEIYALSSLTKSNELKNEYPNLKVYDRYEDLLEDKEIDIVYIANRHKDHYKWTIEALKHKKAVLCEKPATLTYEENEEIVRVAKENQTFFMEAMKSRFIPLMNDIKDLIDKDEIDEITRVETCYSYCIPEMYYDLFKNIDKSKSHYLFDKQQGGILNDTGSYCISCILDFIQSPVKIIQSTIQYQDEVDANDIIEITFESNQTARIEIAFNEDKPKLGTIYGIKGKIELEPFYRPIKAKVIKNNECYEMNKEYIYDDFYTEIEEVHQCLLENKIQSDRMSFQDSLNLRELTDRIRESF